MNANNRGGAWNTGGGCHLEVIPDLESEVAGEEYSMHFKTVVDEISRLSNGSLKVLNVTGMTWRRRDGHPSIYKASWPQNVSLHRQDCSHWCLPGVPDSWNELLYALFLNHELATQS